MIMRPTGSSLADKAYAHVKRDILSGNLAPEAVVDEGRISQALGTSKTPVRQALSRLSAEGFVRVLPQRGTLVNRVSLRDIQHVYLIRQLLEPEASELAATRATPEQVAMLRRLDEERETSSDPNLMLDKHTEFHVAVAAIAGVPRLTKMVAELQEQMQWFLTTRVAEGGTLPRRHHHQELVSAIEKGDGSEARRITDVSIRQSREQLLRGLVVAELLSQS